MYGNGIASMYRANMGWLYSVRCVLEEGHCAALKSIKTHRERVNGAPTAPGGGQGECASRGRSEAQAAGASPERTTPRRTSIRDPVRARITRFHEARDVPVTHGICSYSGQD